MKINNVKILFAAEIDAVDFKDNIVEIKSGNPKYFGIKLVF